MVRCLFRYLVFLLVCLSQNLLAESVREVNHYQKKYHHHLQVLLSIKGAKEFHREYTLDVYWLFSNGKYISLFRVLKPEKLYGLTVLSHEWESTDKVDERWIYFPSRKGIVKPIKEKYWWSGVLGTGFSHIDLERELPIKEYDTYKWGHQGKKYTSFISNPSLENIHSLEYVVEDSLDVVIQKNYKNATGDTVKSMKIHEWVFQGGIRVPKINVVQDFENNTTSRMELLSINSLSEIPFLLFEKENLHQWKK